MRIAKNKWIERKIDRGELLALDSPVRLDDDLVAEDLFGQETAEIDIVLDSLCSAKPTGHRTYSGSEDEHFMGLGSDWILD